MRFQRTSAYQSKSDDLSVLAVGSVAARMEPKPFARAWIPARAPVEAHSRVICVNERGGVRHHLCSLSTWHVISGMLADRLSRLPALLFAVWRKHAFGFLRRFPASPEKSHLVHLRALAQASARSHAITAECRGSPMSTYTLARGPWIWGKTLRARERRSCCVCPQFTEHSETQCLASIRRKNER